MAFIWRWRFIAWSVSVVAGPSWISGTWLARTMAAPDHRAQRAARRSATCLAGAAAVAKGERGLAGQVQAEAQEKLGPAGPDPLAAKEERRVVGPDPLEAKGGRRAAGQAQAEAQRAAELAQTEARAERRAEAQRARRAAARVPAEARQAQAPLARPVARGNRRSGGTAARPSAPSPAPATVPGPSTSGAMIVVFSRSHRTTRGTPQSGPTLGRAGKLPSPGRAKPPCGRGDCRDFQVAP